MLAFRDHPCSWSPDLALTGTSALQLARALLTLVESRQTPRHPDSPHWLQRAAVKRVKHTEAASFTPSSCRLRATSPRSPRSLLRSQLHRTALHRTCPHNAALHCTAPSGSSPLRTRRVRARRATKHTVPCLLPFLVGLGTLYAELCPHHLHLHIPSPLVATLSGKRV
jgi:hypothetical protein